MIDVVEKIFRQHNLRGARRFRELLEAEGYAIVPTGLEIVTLVRQYRQAWRDAIEDSDAAARHRENWDGSDSNVAGFDKVMDALLSQNVTSQ